MSFLCNGCGGHFEGNNEHSCKAIKTNPHDIVMGTLTKREYFSVLIMQGLVARPQGAITRSEIIQMADMLIEELNK